MNINVHPRVLRIRAGAVRDATGVAARPGVVVVDNGRIAYAGSAAGAPHTGDDVRTLDLPRSLVLPGMVNAHAHLSMTRLGPLPYGGSFTDWIRQTSTKLFDDFDQGGSVRAAVRQGAAMLHDAGVAAVGDITLRRDALDAYDELSRSPLAGVSFMEILSPGGPAIKDEWRRLEQLEQEPAQRGRIRMGLQPHAPYSTVPALYQACVDLARQRDLPLTTHLAELPAEAEYVARATGPFREMIERLGQWRDATAMHYCHDLTPVQWLAPMLEQAAFVVAHCNYVSDADLQRLAACGASVAYCPIASEYYGHRDHRYRDMLAAGVNVCLGSDSLACADPHDAQPLSILSQMRRLYQRDGADPAVLLAMATTHGVRALQLPADFATLKPQAPATLVSIAFDPDDPTDPLAQALRGDARIEAINHHFSLPRSPTA